MSAADYDSWQETVYLLQSPANARRLTEAATRDRTGNPGIEKSTEELDALTGEP